MKTFCFGAFVLMLILPAHAAPLEIPFDTELIIRTPKMPTPPHASQVRAIIQGNADNGLICNISCKESEIITGVVCNNHYPPKDAPGEKEIIAVYTKKWAATCTAKAPMGDSCAALCMTP
jgi:hypothetical protein